MKNKSDIKLWGGRFSGAVSDVTERISASVSWDKRLFAQDIRGSRAHASMLHRMGILSADELGNIIRGLSEIELEIEKGIFEFSSSLEDVHMNIEAALTRKIGEAGKKLHTARSRNDQVATDLRMYIKDQSAEIESLLKVFILLLVDKSRQNIELIMPGYTHLQVAQPVRLSQHLLAYAWNLSRDLVRLKAAFDSSDSLPLGSGALAGVNYENDRDFLKKELGFSRIIMNSMDAVSDRDFVLDFLYFSAVLGAHLSRFCEELVLWSSSEFNYIRLSDSVTTGSSIMPQKRNPDVAELIRGKSGRLFANLFNLFTVLKGLPMTYNRDLQEDKEPLFDSVDTVRLCLEGMIEMLSGMEIKALNMRRAVLSNFSTATDLADYLSRAGVPFRQAHEIIGNIVKHCEKNNMDFFKLTFKDLSAFAAEFGRDAVDYINPENSTEGKKSAGSTSKNSITVQMEQLENFISAFSLTGI